MKSISPLSVDHDVDFFPRRRWDFSRRGVEGRVPPRARADRREIFCFPVLISVKLSRELRRDSFVGTLNVEELCERELAITCVA